MNVVFFCRHFLERGTEVAIYDYANCNETILGNKSYIVTFTRRKRASMGWPVSDESLSKFKKRFHVIELESIRDMKTVILRHNIQIFYTLCAGFFEEVYQFENKYIWKNCKVIKHCVFEPVAPQGDFYCVISEHLNQTYKTNYPVIPHMISLPSSMDTMRNQLGIPEDATVFGGYGAKTSFDIPYVHQAIHEFALKHPNVYFVFANFPPFCPPLPNILHLPVILDPTDKVRFINTMDAMMWGRSGGEIMSVAMGEFSIRNKPIICSKTGDLGHVLILKDRAFWYHDKESLLEILESFDRVEEAKKDWNAYAEFTPERVMATFQTVFRSLLDS